MKDEVSEDNQYRIQAQSTLLRVEKHRPLLDELAGLRPVTRAVFGIDVEKALAEFQYVIGEIQFSVKQYARTIGQVYESEQSREKRLKRDEKNEAVFWSGMTADDEGNSIPDEIESREKRTVQALERMLRPHLDEAKR